MERVVDRSELLSEPSTRPSSPDIEDLKNLGEFEYVRNDNNGSGNQTADGDDEAADEMDFCLFASVAEKATAISTVAKIRIQTPPLEDGEPGILSQRPHNYYFTDLLPTEEREKIQSMAISGEEILSRAHSAWPGSTCDWKVLHIAATKRQRLLLTKNADSFANLVGDGLEAKRKRPGKKARLKVRAKLSAARDKKEESRKAAEEKEAAEREKRTRRNREKKVKKKQREKAKKAIGSGGTVVDDENSDGSSSD